jgi:hypothetical protein
MFGNVEKKKLELVLDLLARVTNTLESQEPFLMALLHAVNTYGLADKIDPKNIEGMWESIQNQVKDVKQVLAMEGKPYPPISAA